MGTHVYNIIYIYKRAVPSFYAVMHTNCNDSLHNKCR